MKKKILCLALCVVMVLASFVSCAEKSRDEVMNKIGKDTSEGAQTLTMYIMAEEAVSKVQEDLIENAVNKILDAYKIKLDLRYNTEANYYKTLEENLKQHKAYNEDPNKEKDTEVPVYTDENGLPKRFYPSPKEFQVDLFYFGGYDKYLQYKEAGYLANFTSELTNNASLLKGGISSIYYENVKALNGSYDMMPVNAEVGEYTYMLLNKKFSNTQFKVEELESPVSDKCVELLAMVKEIVESEEDYADFVPFYSSEGVLSFDDVKFFGVDNNGFAADDFSLLAGTYNSSWKYGAEKAYPVMSVLPNTVDNGSHTVIDQIKILKNYEFNGYYGTEEDADKPFAVGYIKGGLDVLEKYSEDYEIVVLDTPTLTTEAFYENAIAISSTTKSVPLSSRVLAELYTNEELINILVNGIEGENYIWMDSNVLDENDEPYRVIEKQTKDKRYIYNIDPYKLGNVANIYPTVDEDPKRPERILQQNSDSKKDLTFGFAFYGLKIKVDKEDVVVDLSPLKKVTELSKTVYDSIIAAKNNEELDAVLAEIEKLVENEDIINVLSSAIASEYTSWAEKNTSKDSATNNNTGTGTDSSTDAEAGTEAATDAA